MKWMERSKRSLTVRMKHEDDYGVIEDSNLSHSVRASNKEDSQKDIDTNWQQKRETTKTKDLQCMKTHALASTTLTCSPSVSGHFTNCWFSLCTHFASSIQLLSLYPFIQFLTCTRIPCRDSHYENCLVRCCLYNPRRLQQTDVRSNCNKIENIKKSWKSLVWGFYPQTANNGFHRSIISLCMHPHLSTFFELLRTPPGITLLPPTGGRTRWLVPLLILPVGQRSEWSFSRFLV